MKASLIKPNTIIFILLFPFLLTAQQVCEPNYSIPYLVTTHAVDPAGQMSNNSYNLLLTTGYAFNTTADNITENSAVMGFWSTYLKEPRPPIVRASDGDFQNAVLVQWTVEGDRTGPPVTGSEVQLYRNGYVLTTLPVSQTQYQDLNVFPGTYYDYGVTSSNAMGTSHTEDDVGFLSPNGVITGHIETPSGNPVAETKVTLTPNVGRSAYFDGASYIYFFDENTSANRQFSGLSGNYTIETWFRSLHQEPQTILAAVDSATSDQYVRLELTAAGKVRWLHSAGSDSAVITTVNPYAGAGSDWHHLAAVFNTNTMTLYIDGNIVGNTTASGPVNDHAEIIIGKRSPYDHNRYFRGWLDDFRIWSTAREWGDLRKVMDLTLSGTEPQLAGYWKFDEMEGTVLFDLTANNIDAAICGIDHDYRTAPVYVGAITDSTGNYSIRSVAFGDGTTFTVTPNKTTPVGRSLQFDGSGDYISFPNRRIDLTGSYTLEGWFKTGAASEQTVLAGVNPADGSARMRVDVTAGGNLSFNHYSASVTSTSAFNDELWHHYAAVFDSANGKIKLYADGETVDSAAVAGAIPDPTEIVIARRAPGAATHDFDGFLDEMRVWNTARTYAQIGGTMNQTLVGDEYGLAHYWRLNEGIDNIVADATGHQLTGTIQGDAAWTQDIPLNEVFEHYYAPESRQASLNNSNTSVDLVNFTDISMIAISGYVNYVGSTCSQEGVEILVNNQSLTPNVVTDANGKYILEMEPGRSGDVISASYRDHQFTPPLIELPLITTPLAGLNFTDLTKRDLEVTVAGGVEHYPISPSQGKIGVTVRAINGCVEKSDSLNAGAITLTFQDLPPLIYQVTVDHPNPAIDGFFTGDTISLEDIDRSIEFIYRSQPEVSIAGLPVDSCSHTVLNMYEEYPVTFNVFETYISHNDTGSVTNLSPSDTGSITIVNTISDLGEETLEFSNGAAQYTIIGGIPNILSGGEHPYQKNITVSATDDLGRTTDLVEKWAYVTGNKPRNDGNYFATTTPELPLMVLRAPPGDGSTMTIEEGTTVEQSMGFSMIQDESSSAFAALHLGADFEVEIGFIVSTTVSVDVTMDFTSEMSVGVSQGSETEQTWTWTTNETFSTTPNAGDVYVGGAMNIVYGITDVLEMTPACTVSVSPEIIMVPDGFATTYIYSEHYLESILIPQLLNDLGDTTSARSWQNIIARNDTLKKWSAILATNPDTLYSMDSTDVAALATDFFSGATNLVPENLQDFPEPEPEDADYEDPESDLPFGAYFDELMASGISLEPTLDAPPPTGEGLNRNISFDAGAVYSYTLTTGMSKTEKVNYEMVIADEVAMEVGATVNGIGAEGGFAVATQMTRGKSESVTEERTRTVSFTLADDDAGTGDNFSVDILTDGVFGPVFKVVSGASSCPWEPGTVAFDGPQLGISPGVQVDVPPNEPATFTLNIGNTSPMSIDREYHLRVINASNPDGAVIAVNGNIIEDFMSFFVPAGESVEATMTVERGPEAYAYENLQLQLVSPCQYVYWQDGWDMALADTVIFDVSYLVPCSESNIAAPENNWLVTSATASDTLWVTVDSYDRFDPNLEQLWLQYRRVSSTGNVSGPGSDPYPAGQPPALADWEMAVSIDEINNARPKEMFAPQLRISKKGQKTELGANSSRAPLRMSPKAQNTRGKTAPIRNKGGGSKSPISLTGTDPPVRKEIGPNPVESFSRDGEWFTARVIPADSLVDDYVLIPWNIAPTIIIDGTYELRASARCGGDLIPGTSPIVTGIIDRQAPQLLGAPTPVDGILNPDDIISITFNENVECGEISPGAGDITLTNTVTNEVIDFTYTCGGNVITIEPNIQNQFIENQILRASIGPVGDMYGNVQTSAIEWEFFVNRNPISWSGTNIADIVIHVDETYSTTRQIVNNGGSNRDWSIIGGREGDLPTGDPLDIPSWLEVSPLSGTLTPGSSQDVSIALSDDLNFGEYNTTIYAAGTMGDEPLLVDIRKLCYPPPWTVEPSNYQFSMNITATLSVDDVLSDDEYDMVGVFVDNEVRGTALIEYVPSLADLSNTHPYEVFLTIYSNVSQGEELSFRVWDASECTELGWVEESYSFVADAVHGTPTSPVTITATSQIITRIPYPAGWNWFSLNLEKDDMSINTVLTNLTPAEGDIIKSQNSYAQYVPDYGWVGNLDSLYNESMYQIRISTADTLEMVGYAVDVELDTIPVESGWNWIGYLPQSSLEINWALSTLDAAATGDLIKSQFSYAQFVEGLGWIGSLNYMHPKLGYNLKAMNAGQLVYPFTAPPPVLAKALADGDPGTLPENQPEWTVNPSDFQYNLTLTGTVAMENVEASDVIGAFVTDTDGVHCRGLAQPVYLEALDQYMVFMMVYGNTTSGEIIEFKYYDESEDETRYVNESIEFQPDLILGTVEEPFAFTTRPLGIDDEGYIPDEFSLSQNYPNPFNPVTNFGFGLPEAGEVTITIYNLLGKEVRTLVSDYREPGYYFIQWDARDEFGRQVSSGLYLTVMQSGTFRDVKKIILLK